jgi:prepilin-type N-terminal cleavage/methylation domain-containing protein
MSRTRKFAKRMKNEEGFSLLEMIASLTLLSLVTGIVYAVITFGLDSYQRVTIENSLRDESDLLMSSIIAEIYEFGPDSIKDVRDETNKQVGILLKKSEGASIVERTIKLQDNALYIGQGATDGKKIDIKSTIVSETAVPSDPSDSKDSKIMLECDKTIECRSGLIVIELTLAQQFKEHDRTLTVRSKFGF